MTEPLQHRHSPTDPPLAKRLWDFEPGSRVVIEPGTYVGGMVLPHDVTLVAEKGLGTVTLESSRGPLLSVEGAGRVHLEGLILRGSAIGLGAVLVIDSEAEVEVRGCLLSGGRGEGVGGGGVAIRVGKLVMARCRLVDNTALQGGALSACGPALVEVSNSVFARNSAEGLGGGAVFANEGARVRLLGCSFVDNTAKAGRAVHAGSTSTLGGHVELANCLLAKGLGENTLLAEGQGTIAVSHSVVPPGADKSAGGVSMGEAVIGRLVELPGSGPKPFSAPFPVILRGLGDHDAFGDEVLDLHGQRRDEVWVGAVR